MIYCPRWHLLVLNVQQENWRTEIVASIFYLIFFLFFASSIFSQITFEGTEGVAHKQVTFIAKYFSLFANLFTYISISKQKTTMLTLDELSMQ